MIDGSNTHMKKGSKSKIRKQSKNVIHITIKSSNHSDKSRVIQTTIQNDHQPNNDEEYLSINQHRKAHSENRDNHRVWPTRQFSSKNILHKDSSTIDQHGLTIDHHQNLKKEKKNKRTRRYIIGFLIIALLLITIILTTLLVLFLKPKTTTKSLIASLRWNTTGITIAGISGVPGNSSNALNRPFDVTIDYAGTIYIADKNNARIQKYLINSLNGITIAGQTNLPGLSSNQLNGPTSVFVDESRNIFIADTSNHRIQYWTNGATFGTTLAGNTSGVPGSTNDSLSSPFAISRNPKTATLYIADYNNRRIMSYESGALSGVVVAGGNGGGLNNSELCDPFTCYFDSVSNSFIIANGRCNNIVRWILGDKNWTLLHGDRNGLAGNTTTLLFTPRDLTMDPMGNIYVVERNNHRVQLFLTGQIEGITIAGITGMFGINSSMLNAPLSVELDSQLNLYVTDTDNHRIQKFMRY